jgi:hypothetical protein
MADEDYWSVVPITPGGKKSALLSGGFHMYRFVKTAHWLNLTVLSAFLTTLACYAGGIWARNLEPSRSLKALLFLSSSVILLSWIQLWRERGYPEWRFRQLRALKIACGFVASAGMALSVLVTVPLIWHVSQVSPDGERHGLVIPLLIGLFCMSLASLVEFSSRLDRLTGPYRKAQRGPSPR